MKRLVGLILIGFLFVFGCSAVKPRAEAPVPTAAEEPTATLLATHGENLLRANIEFGPEGQVVLTVRLKSGEPTGTEPFAALAMLASLYPERTRFQVNYPEPLPTPQLGSGDSTAAALADKGLWDGIVFNWSSKGQVNWHRVILIEGDRPVRLRGSYANGIDTATLQAVATGRQPIPVFTSMR